MTTHDHFKSFKHKHRMSAVTNIANPNLTTNEHGNGHKMQESKHLSEKLPLPMRLKEYWHKYTLKLGRGWEPVVVNKSVDSVTMPKWIASSILGTVLLFGVSSWWRSSDQRDLLIEMRTELRIAKEEQAKRESYLNAKLGDLEAWKNVTNNKLSEIKGMLTQQQIDAIERLNRGTNQH